VHSIPVFRPTLDWKAVAREMRPVIKSGWLGLGPKVEELEARLASEAKAKHFIATSSCTAALHLAVKVLDLRPGSSVQTTPISFVSTNAVLLYEQLQPVFGPVDRNGNATRQGSQQCPARIVVHLGGAECRYNDLPGQTVIEDCAHAFGAPWIETQRALMRCWSFHAVKNLPMGDGGGISTNDDELAARLRRLRWMGIDKSTHARNQGGYTTEYSIPELGFKYHMNDVAAAIGLATLPLVADQIKQRRRIAERYRAAFPANAPSYLPRDSACHFYPLFFEDREAVEGRLRAANVSYSRHYQPNFMYQAFRNCIGYGSDTAMEYWRRVLVLPMFPGMTDEEIERVIGAVRG